MNFVTLVEKSKHLITSCSNESLPREPLGSAGTETSGVHRAPTYSVLIAIRKKVTISAGFWYELNRWIDLQVELGLILSLFIPGFISCNSIDSGEVISHLYQ